VNVLKTWVTEYYQDFKSDPELLNPLKEFVNGTLSQSTYKNIATQILQTIAEFESNKNPSKLQTATVDTKKVPKPKINRRTLNKKTDFNFYDVAPKEVISSLVFFFSPFLVVISNTVNDSDGQTDDVDGLSFTVGDPPTRIMRIRLDRLQAIEIA